MVKEKWQEDISEMISNILDFKEVIKNAQVDLESEKVRLMGMLKQHNLSQFTCEAGKVNFVRFEREGLVKDNVVDTVEGVNKGRITKINMGDLTKDIKVCFINVRGFM
ncbi:MAG: hypothetical protein RSA29_16995 [Clostridium sp.]|uniref:hypothetical protein n=1 Tax=Clostridium sp. TaxID=1506 RepID=UPI0030645E04